tara:strand:- start:416 stop:739 length:324 start_codon:yes stop_codon:yes gene_type:complete
MALTRYHNIAGATQPTVELLAPGDGASGIASVLIANIHASNAATVTLFIQKSSTNKTFKIINLLTIPAGSSFIVDEASVLSFNNSPSGFGLYITVGNSDTVDVLINF